MSSPCDDINDALAAHRQHAPSTALQAASGPASITLLNTEQIASPRQHWHIIETNRKTRLLGRAHIVAETGIADARDAFHALTARTSELLIEGWSLDLTHSNDRQVVLTKANLTATIEAKECWELSCVASLRASTLATAGIGRPVPPITPVLRC